MGGVWWVAYWIMVSAPASVGFYTLTLNWDFHLGKLGFGLKHDHTLAKGHNN